MKKARQNINRQKYSIKGRTSSDLTAKKGRVIAGQQYKEKKNHARPMPSLPMPTAEMENDLEVSIDLRKDVRRVLFNSFVMQVQ